MCIFGQGWEEFCSTSSKKFTQNKMLPENSKYLSNPRIILEKTKIRLDLLKIKTQYFYMLFRDFDLEKNVKNVAKLKKKMDAQSKIFCSTKQFFLHGCFL
jgi:hypothetical protein